MTNEIVTYGYLKESARRFTKDLELIDKTIKFLSESDGYDIMLRLKNIKTIIEYLEKKYP